MTRILVVEDSPAIRTFVHKALEGSLGEGLGESTVVEASDGFDAMRLLPRGQFDLVISDIHMPDINGLELVRFLRGGERYASVAVLLITSQGASTDRDRGMALGADGFLQKPFSPEELREAARVALSARRSATGGAHAARTLPPPTRRSAG